MGFTKIIQYGNITEIYEYEKELKSRGGIDHVKAQRLMYPETVARVKRNLSVHDKRKELVRIQRKQKRIPRTEYSIRKSKTNFFRLCHHNNCYADTINFLTLTFTYDITQKEAQKHIKRFMERVAKNRGEISLSYISVPELTKKGRLHFHLLVYNLPPESAELERKTRNFQRLFQRGYVDISSAEYTSAGIAGYMAKYMAKSIGDENNGTRKGFTCSRNIKRPTSEGSNALTGYTNLFVPTERVVDIESRKYNVPYLGDCLVTKITTQI